MNTAIVIAAYNEQGSVGNVVREVKKAGYPWVIVVDDGSKDKTYDEAVKAGADVLQNVINRGQGAALRAGINYALQEGADIIVTYDADGQFRANEIGRVIEPVKKGRADITLGSRFLGETVNISTGKKLVLKLGALVTFIFSGIMLSDSHNGFRALNRKAASKIRITFDRMEHASEIIEEISTWRLKYEEVPVTVIYHEAGQHPLKSIKMGIRLVAKKVLGW